MSKKPKQKYPMEVTLLGTGTSTGVPMIGCDCETCRSDDPRDKRLRTSAFVEVNGLKLLIDIGPDFRQQMLREQIRDIDAVLITHEHNDHIAALDEIRAFNFLHRKVMPVYASARVAEVIRRRFAYMFAANPYPGAPRVELHTIELEETIELKGISIMPIEVLHGAMPILGFRIQDFTYLTDMKYIKEAEFKKVVGTQVLVVSALHQNLHFSHMNIAEATDFVQQIKPERAYFIHASHNMGRYAAVAPSLADSIVLGYDGLKIQL